MAESSSMKNYSNKKDTNMDKSSESPLEINESFLSHLLKLMRVF